MSDAAGGALDEAVEIMDRLWRAGGWEATQTHESLAHYLVEETYEVLDAIASGNADDLREELGDLLLQVLFHSRIAAADGRFDVDDVAAALVGKLVHRSPHLSVDGAGPVDIAEQERAWEERKAAEKARPSCLDGVSSSQPAVSRAVKVLDRARRAGLPAEFVPDELTVAVAAAEAAEAAVRAVTDRFAARVRDAETRARADGAAGLSTADWERYWPRPERR